MTLHSAPPTHWQLYAVALAIDAVLGLALAMTLLVLQSTARPACTCDRGEEA